MEAGIRLRPSVLDRRPVLHRGVEASIRSIAYTNAFATRLALPPLPARDLPNALLRVPLSLLAFHRVSYASCEYNLIRWGCLCYRFLTLLKYILQSSDKPSPSSSGISVETTSTRTGKKELPGVGMRVSIEPNERFCPTPKRYALLL